MELQGENVVFTHRERRILDISSRIVPTVRLGRLWSAIVKANTEKIRPYEQGEKAKSNVVTAALMAVGGHPDDHYIEYSNLKQQSRMIAELSHSVLAISCETVPADMGATPPQDL